MKRDARQPGLSDQVAADKLVWQYRVPGATRDVAPFYHQLLPHVEDALYSHLVQKGFGGVGEKAYLDVGRYRVELELVGVEPPLATSLGRGTRLELGFVQPGDREDARESSFIAATLSYPDEAMGRLYGSLVGIDHIKQSLLSKLALCFSRRGLRAWSRERYGAVVPACEALLNRYPFFILEGDVGCGKTALARSIGHPLAKQLGRPVEMLTLNTQVRGRGMVGELSNNITQAFQLAEARSREFGRPTLLLIDEADALAQTRGGRQMHHEDNAGVNTLIQRIDLLQGPGLETVVLFATNMGSVLDPAIRRRAAAVFCFCRPDEQGRRVLFSRLLEGCGVTDEDVTLLVQATSPRRVPGYGDSIHPYTYSDIAQRIVPTAFERSFLEPGKCLRVALLEGCHEIPPTPLTAAPTV